MTAEKSIKQGDVYLSAHDISKKLDIPVRAIYRMRNLNKVRWIENSTLFNLDDVRKYVVENGYENLIKEANIAGGLSD